MKKHLVLCLSLGLWMASQMDLRAQSDIVFQNVYNPDLKTWFMNGENFGVEIGVYPPGLEPGGSLVAAGDLDGDGYGDFVFERN